MRRIEKGGGRETYDELRGNSKRPRNSEQDSVEALLLEAVVRKKNTRVGINVRPRVLGLSSLKEDVGHERVELADQLEKLVVRQVLERELSLGLVSRVGLPQNGVSVTRDDLTTVERLPNVLGDLLVRGVNADLVLHLCDPVEDLLVGEPVQGAGETVQGGGHREEGVREGRSDEVTSVGLKGSKGWISARSRERQGARREDVPRRYLPRGQSGW